MPRKIDFEAGAAVAGSGVILTLYAAYSAVPAFGVDVGVALVATIFVLVAITIGLIRRSLTVSSKNHPRTRRVARKPEVSGPPILRQTFAPAEGEPGPSLEQVVFAPPTGMVGYYVTTTNGHQVWQTTVVPIPESPDTLQRVGTLTVPAPNAQPDPKAKKEKSGDE